VLSDPDKRKRYDTLGPDWERYAQGGPAGGHTTQRGGPGGGFRYTYNGAPGANPFGDDASGFSDFFQTIFGGRFAEAIYAAIQDPAVLALRPHLGSVNQFLAESGDALQSIAFCRGLIDDLHGRLSVESLSDQLSALADLVLDATVAACWTSLRRDDWPEVPAFAVIAFGKLGGKELGYASDLDLVFLFDERESDDEAEAVERYVRFARRLNVWLTARTSAGTLFEIDLRLRPDGEAGMVVSSFAGWSRYERRERDVGAWTWEHQALTRARFAAGDRRLALDFERERVEILASLVSDDAGRDRLRGDIAAMRVRMHDGHPNRSGLFDLKHDEGGMVDIEFAVQYLVLAYGGERRELLDDVGNIALLGRAADAGLVARDIAIGAADAYRTFRARQHAARLAEPDAKAARVAADTYPAERRVVRALWEALFGRT
jgi:glutamate-ammonia-ligase adenylyltransferase